MNQTINQYIHVKLRSIYRFKICTYQYHTHIIVYTVTGDIWYSYKKVIEYACIVFDMYWVARWGGGDFRIKTRL